MFRFILIGTLLILMFLLARSALRGRRRRNAEDQFLTNTSMIQDPFCKAYTPRGSAVAAKIGGQTYYFCSGNCAQAFERQLKG
jgi:YHS domain-containing protein